MKFYCDGLGIEPAAIWNNGDGHALVVNMGQATLELFDETQDETIDSLEAMGKVGADRDPPLRAHGATLVHPPVLTPWDDYNVRLQDPDGMQIKLFEVSKNSSE